MYLTKQREFQNLVRNLYIKFNAAPKVVPGALVIYQDLYAVFETVPISPKKSIFFHCELYRKYSNRMFNTNRAYEYKLKDQFESEGQKAEIIKHYSGSGYVIDDLTEYPQFKDNRCMCCGKILEGRPDKIYCSKACGNTGRNFKNSDELYFLEREWRDTLLPDKEYSDRFNDIKNHYRRVSEVRKCFLMQR